jgi:sugar O-acyltransferase (sialic acid O-acetyltransferase NeuD family)
MSNKLIIFGSKGTATELKEFLKSDERFDEIRIVFIEENLGENELVKQWAQDCPTVSYIFGVLDASWRKIALTELKKLTNFKPFTYIHPTAFVAKSAIIGDGVYVGPNSTIAPFAVLKDHSHVNLNASIGHHSILGEHSAVLPGARISGNVNIEANCLIGSNAVLFQGITINRNCTVDALTYIKKDVPENTISFSTKTKTLKKVL